MMTQFRILSLNMHKGYDIFGRTSLLKLKDLIQQSQADIVLLQEVSGLMSDSQKLDHKVCFVDQLEYLADMVWPYGQYGKNAVLPKRHHGNAILSKYPILEWANFDISETLFEGRGLLMSCIEVIPGQTAWICNTHLSLFHRDRVKQFRRISWHLKAVLGPSTPVILGGDFNDWNCALSLKFQQQVALREAFKEINGVEALTFPAFRPTLRLDRLYFSGCECSHAEVLRAPWSKASDHLPLFAHFTTKMLLS